MDERDPTQFILIPVIGYMEQAPIRSCGSMHATHLQQEDGHPLGRPQPLKYDHKANIYGITELREKVYKGLAAILPISSYK